MFLTREYYLHDFPVDLFVEVFFQKGRAATERKSKKKVSLLKNGYYLSLLDC